MLSHLECWRRIARSGDELALVLEDDTVLEEDFVTKLHDLLMRVPSDRDMVYLGCTTGCNPGGESSVFEVYGKLSGLGYQHRHVNGDVFIPTYPMGMNTYVISRKGALKLLAGYERDGGVREAMDVQVLSYNLSAYAAAHKLAWQYRSLGVSTIVGAGFPRVLNLLFDHVQVDEETTLAYALADPLVQVWGLAVSPWSVIIVLNAVWYASTSRGLNVLPLAFLVYVADHVTALLLTYRPAPSPRAFHAMSRTS